MRVSVSDGVIDVTHCNCETHTITNPARRLILQISISYISASDPFIRIQSHICCVCVFLGAVWNILLIPNYIPFADDVRGTSGTHFEHCKTDAKTSDTWAEEKGRMRRWENLGCLNIDKMLLLESRCENWLARMKNGIEMEMACRLQTFPHLFERFPGKTT